MEYSNSNKSFIKVEALTVNPHLYKGYLRHHLEDSEDISTSYHQVLLSKVKEGAREAKSEIQDLNFF